MSTVAVWWFLLSVFIILGIVGSLLYFWFRKDSNNKRLWLVWGFGVSAYMFLASLILFAVASPRRAKARIDGVVNIVDARVQGAQQKYRDLAKKAGKDKDCKTDQQKCVAAVNQDKNLTRNEKTAQLANCRNESDTNVCTDALVAACADAIEARNDSSLTEKFTDIQNNKGTQEVLSFCNNENAVD
jgi:hypothetical protein